MRARPIAQPLPWLVGLLLALCSVVLTVVIDASPVVPATSVANSPIISASGTQLYLNGSPYHFVGVNAYEAGTEWGTNAGCGADLSDDQMNQLFASLRPIRWCGSGHSRGRSLPTSKPISWTGRRWTECLLPPLPTTSD